MKKFSDTLPLISYFGCQALRRLVVAVFVSDVRLHCDLSERGEQRAVSPEQVREAVEVNQWIVGTTARERRPGPGWEERRGRRLPPGWAGRR